MMKTRFFRGLGAALGLAVACSSPVVQAADEPAPDAKSLAMTEAILDYCVKLDPAHASNYQKRVQLVALGASEETLAKVRNTDDYQRTHDSTVESLAKVKEQDARKACAQALPEIR